MTLQPAGTTVSYTRSFLEMRSRPAYGHPPRPAGRPAILVRAETPPAWYFLSLYDAVGRDYAWEDMHALNQTELTEWLADPAVSLYTLMRDGWQHGFFLLDGTEAGRMELAYFGLVPEAVGSGLGTWLLKTALLTGWDSPGVTRMTVNTCSLDHPRALALYQKVGFQVVGREELKRTLTRPRDLSRIPD